MTMTSFLKLIEIIYNDNKLLFPKLESVRSCLRVIEGKSGTEKRKSIKDKSQFREEPRPYNPYSLPESHEEIRKPFKLPTACNNILVISDLHIPYHNINAITLALDYGKQQKVNTILILGDLIDNHQVSRFEKDLSKRSVKDEFDATKQFLVSLREVFPNASIYWAKGNHCIRWELFLMQKVKEIWNDPYFHLEERLKLNEQRITMIDDKVLIKIGKLTAAHGHHIFKGVFVPVSPARGAFLRTKQSMIVGHLHRASHHPEVTADGEVISCWSLGCLCELKPSYSPQVSNSQHGFAHITVEKNGNYKVRNFQIIKGEIF
jgi:predicted phosphodiesterase